MNPIKQRLWISYSVQTKPSLVDYNLESDINSERWIGMEFKCVQQKYEGIVKSSGKDRDEYSMVVFVDVVFVNVTVRKIWINYDSLYFIYIRYSWQRGVKKENGGGDISYLCLLWRLFENFKYYTKKTKI